MRVKKHNLFLIVPLIFLILIFTKDIKAQDFEVSVIMEMTSLSNDAKDKLKDFKLQVENYFNRNKFADGEIYKIKASIQFSFRGYDGFDGYDAQVFFASQRVIDTKEKRTNPRYTTLFRYLDEKCSFSYNRSMSFILNFNRFDSFLSLLDYYALIMLGYDCDSFFPVKIFPQKSGSQYFQKALDLCNKPMTNRSGWSESGGGSKPTRLLLVQELLSAKFVDFRDAIFEYHWNGLDSLPYTKNAYEHILNALEAISKTKKSEARTWSIDMFYETKNQEIADLFLNYGNRNVYDRLMTLDPGHVRIYEEAKKNAK
jgi:hypothetical protein